MSELSVIVPVYKVSAYLDACVESLLRQEVPGMEILLVDDGSPDECGAMCDAWAQRADCIQVVHRANGGLSAARNTGIAMATGRYLTFVDSDDAVAPGTYAPLMEVLHNAPSVDLLEYPVCRHTGTAQECLWRDEKVDVAYSSANTVKALQTDALAHNPIFQHWMTHRGHQHTYAWNKIYARSLWSELRYPEGRYYEDTLTIIPLLQQVRHYHFEPTGAYLYYDRPGSISRSNNARKVQDLLEGHMMMQHAMLQFVAAQGATTPSSTSKDDVPLETYRHEHLCTVVNTLIDLLDTGFPADAESLQSLWFEIDRVHPSVGESRRLPMAFSARLKAMFCSLLGAKRHCQLQHLLHHYFKS